MLCRFEFRRSFVCCSWYVVAVDTRTVYANTHYNTPISCGDFSSRCSPDKKGRYTQRLRWWLFEIDLKISLSPQRRIARSFFCLFRRFFLGKKTDLVGKKLPVGFGYVVLRVVRYTSK